MGDNAEPAGFLFGTPAPGPANPAQYGGELAPTAPRVVALHVAAPHPLVNTPVVTAHPMVSAPAPSVPAVLTPEPGPLAPVDEGDPCAGCSSGGGVAAAAAGFAGGLLIGYLVGLASKERKRPRMRGR